MGLNTVTAGDGYPIPSVSNVLDALSGGKKFAKLDLASGYWQVLVNPVHVHKAAFATHLGLYEFLRMPYGLWTAPQTFQRILNSVFADFLYQWLIIYIDDVVVWANTDHEALSRYELRGLVKACPYLQMDGESQGGLYLLSLNQEAFRKLFLDCDQRVSLPYAFI